MGKIIPVSWSLRLFLIIGVIGIFLLPATIVQYNSYVESGYGSRCEYAGATWGTTSTDFFLNLTFNVSNDGELDAVAKQVQAELFFGGESIGQYTNLVLEGDISAGSYLLVYLKVRVPKNQLPALSSGDEIQASGYIVAEIPYREVTVHLAFDEAIALQ